jgi:hypothetical protein
MLGQQPVQRFIQVVFVHRLHPQLLAQRAVRSLAAQRTGGGEFGGGLKHALGNQRQHPRARGFVLQQLVQFELAHHGEHGGHMTVGQ